MKIEQNEVFNYSSTALELLLTGERIPKADAITKALQGTRLLAMIEAVPLDLKNAAAFDRQAAREMLKTDGARKLFDELVAEGLPRLRLRPKARSVVIAIASAVALHAEAGARRSE